MAKLTDAQVKNALDPFLHDGETLEHWAFGVTQPNIWLIALLFLLGIIPGIIAVFLLTRNFIIGLTQRRLIVLRVKSITNADVKETRHYELDRLPSGSVKASTGPLFTHVRISGEKPFVAKFHRMFSKQNRAHAMAIAEALAGAD